MDQGRHRIDLRHHIDRFRQRGAQQRQCFIHHRDHIDGFPLDPFGPAEGQDLLDQPLGPLARDHQLHGELVLGSRLVQVFDQEGGVAHHGGQDIVEVVGDAAGQPADRLQLLSLMELLLQAGALILGLAALADVADDLHHAAIIQGCQRQFLVESGAVAPAAHQFALPPPGIEQAGQHVGLKMDPFVRRVERQPAPPQQIPRVLEPMKPRMAVVEIGEGPRLIEDRDSVDRRFQGGQPVAQQVFGLLLRGDVGEQADRSAIGRPPLVDQKHPAVDQRFLPRTVGRAQPLHGAAAGHVGESRSRRHGAGQTRISLAIAGAGQDDPLVAVEQHKPARHRIRSPAAAACSHRGRPLPPAGPTGKDARPATPGGAAGSPDRPWRPMPAPERRHGRPGQGEEGIDSHDAARAFPA